MATSKKLPLQTSNNANMVAAGASKKTIEEMYQKKSQIEHILLRPDTYVGSIERHTQTLWVYENDQLVNRSVTYVPGLCKIFDEILVNAADNKQRDPTMDSLKVVINVEENLVTVYNNGDGVPVEIHREEKVYVPELIFGHLLTSSNYDDSMKKTTGGRNGYGAKLANIFSTEFVIETADGKRQKKYKQVFNSNMGQKSEPFITKCKDGENWTKVSFKPDLAKFNMTYLEEDVVSLMKKRVVDMAGYLGKSVKVELNGQCVPVKTFSDYVNLYLKSTERLNTQSVSVKVNDRWEVCATLSDGQFQQVSFVNSIATIKGGTHVDYVTNQMANYVMNIVNKKNKNANVKAYNVRNHLWVFVNALIDNPAFDSQTKETLTILQSSFGSTCELPEDFLKKVSKIGIVETLLSWADFELSKDLKKSDGAKTPRVRGVLKLEDANEAGGWNSEKCTLILTEGDSAKSLAVAAISVVGRDHYGVFPLRGKLLNVREASCKQVKENEEIENLKKILGLQQSKEYINVKSLRYGHLMIMTDQDHDGSHIKGLLINFFHTFWPSLLKVPNFLLVFNTPIVKATHKNGQVISFFNMPEYEAWKESLGANASSWSIKYYKGLGTSTAEEGREYFRNLDKHRREFVWEDEHDGEAIELAFSKKKIDDRKNWLRQFEPGTYLDQVGRHIKYSDFVNKELILFSMADLQRSIPFMLDGLKPGQRKILFSAFKKNLVKETKVAQFVGYVSEKSAYHHGEQSLATSIIGMAQDFVGSNNINVLAPKGQFGTRNNGGKDHASARYIFTHLCPITRLLFHKDDDNLLDYLDEDGQSIEPSWYIPIIPTVLVNGSEGIGTGWSSYIPNYNPKDIIENVRRLLNGETMKPMDPWYRGFRGSIEKSTKEGVSSYIVSGEIEEVNETTLKITELPIRRWTQDYKQFLESVSRGAPNDKVKEQFIEYFRQNGDEKTVDIEVLMTEENMKMAKEEGLLKKFKLTSNISTSNMHLFDSKGTIKKYDTPEQILEEFFNIRFEYYEKRKKYLVDKLELELLKLDNQIRFIYGVVKGDIVVSNRKIADLFAELKDKGFTPFPKKTKAVEPQVAGASDDEAEGGEESTVSASMPEARISDYDYLLSMSIGTLTWERIRELGAEMNKLTNEVEDARATTPDIMWLRDLKALEKELDEIEKMEPQRQEACRKKLSTRAVFKVSKQAAKNPRKDNSKKMNGVETVADTATSATIEFEKPAQVPKPKGKGGPRKPRAKKEKPNQNLEDDDSEIEDLEKRLASYKLGASASDKSAAGMEPEELQVPAKRAPTKPAAAKKKTSITVISDSSQDDQQKEDEYDFDFEEVASERKKKNGRKPAAANRKAAKPSATIKRGRASNKQSDQLLGQKFITDILRHAFNLGISPEKKVRKMRESPFNKKSGSVFGLVANKGNETESADELGSGSTNISYSVEEVAEVAPARAKPQTQRQSRKPTYVLSDSESGTPLSLMKRRTKLSQCNVFIT